MQLYHQADFREQFERKINEYKADLDYSDFEVEYIKSTSASKSAKMSDRDAKIKFVRNKVYIFGKATFRKVGFTHNKRLLKIS